MSLLLKGTIGLAINICLKFLLCSRADAKARRVFPVPATPLIVTSLILGSNNACNANACSAFLGLIP